MGFTFTLKIALFSVSLQCDRKNGCDENYGTGCVVLHSLYNFGLQKAGKKLKPSLKLLLNYTKFSQLKRKRVQTS